jgi:hypothetical protein
VDSESFASLTRAVVIGVDAAPKSGQPILGCAEREAAAIAAALVDPEACGIPRDQVEVLLGSEATRARVIEALERAIARLTPNQTLFLYFAGHSAQENGQSFLCTSDATAGDLANTAIGSRLLDELLRELPAHGLLITLDCCNSAGFGEDLRNTLVESGQGQFRICLAASRKGQASWELGDGEGTLFSRTLLQLLRGKFTTGRKPGQIFFSDLQRELADRIEEGQEANGTVHAQELFAFQATARDPLLFVNRQLSLRQIKLTTEKYSSSFVRQKVVRVANAMVLIAITLVGAAYLVLWKSEYIAVTDTGTVSVFQGLPAFRLPGFPRTLWQTELQSTMLNLPGADQSGFARTARFGASALDLLDASLRSDLRATLWANRGETEGARLVALSVIPSPATAGDDAVDRAMLLIAQLNDPRDEPLLRAWLKKASGASDAVALASLQSLVLADPGIVATPEFAALRERRDISIRTADLLNRPWETCTPSLQRAIDHSIDSRSYFMAGDYHEIGLMLWMSGCEISTERIVPAIAKAMSSGQVAAIAHYLNTRGRAGEADQQLRQLVLKGPVGETWDHFDYIEAVGRLALDSCPAELWARLRAAPVGEQLQLMWALARRCAQRSVTVRWSPGEEGGTIAVELAVPGRGSWRVSVETIEAGLPPESPLSAGGAAMVELLASSPSQDALDALASLSRVDLFRYSNQAIRALLKRDPARLEQFQLDVVARLGLLPLDGSPQQRALFRRKVSELVSREGFFDEIFPGVLALDDADVAELRALLDREPTIAARGACALAMAGSEDDLVRLLSYPGYVVRRRAAECMAFNASAEQAVLRYRAGKPRFPNEFIRAIEYQLEYRQSIERLLAKLTPDEQLMMASFLVDAEYWPADRPIMLWLQKQRSRLAAQSECVTALSCSPKS